MPHPATDASGILHGKTITLDGPVPALDGQRVRIVIAPEDENFQLTQQETTELWHQWLLSGEHGPISDDGEPEFP